MAAAVGWPIFFAGTIAMAIPGVLLVFFLPRSLTEVPLEDEPAS